MSAIVIWLLGDDVLLRVKRKIVDRNGKLFLTGGSITTVLNMLMIVGN